MSRQSKIDSYTFGRIVIDGRTYTSDIIILPSGVIGDWWRNEGHVLKPDDLKVVLEALPTVLIVGQGAYGYMKVNIETLECLRKVGIEVLCMPTGQAVDVYNEHCQRGVTVGAALHLTC